MTRTPQSEGDAPVGGADAETLRRIATLENQTNHSKILIDFVSETNKFILIVLFVGFLGLLLAIIIVVINTITTDTASRQELNSQVQVLNYELQHATVTPNK